MSTIKQEDFRRTPLSLFVLCTVMTEEKDSQLFHAATPPLKWPLGLFPKPLQPYLELIRLDKVCFINVQYIMHRFSF